jgi:hypothetical protein
MHGIRVLVTQTIEKWYCVLYKHLCSTHSLFGPFFTFLESPYMAISNLAGPSSDIHQSLNAVVDGGLSIYLLPEL